MVYGSEKLHTINKTKIRMKIDLTGKNIYITGGTGKLGIPLVAELLRSGANVYLMIRDEKKLDLFKNYKDIDLNNIYPVQCELGDFNRIKSITENIVDGGFNVDGFIHAGVYRPCQLDHSCYDENIHKSLSVNSYSSILLFDNFSNAMKKNGGSIINIGSIYSKVSPDFNLYKGLDMGTEPDYPFIKAGASSAVRYYASKYGRYNVRLNTIVLGGVFNHQPEEFVERYIKKVPLGRMASASDFISACMFLLSDDASYITGSEITVDGGLSAL